MRAESRTPAVWFGAGTATAYLHGGGVNGTGRTRPAPGADRGHGRGRGGHRRWRHSRPCGRRVSGDRSEHNPCVCAQRRDRGHDRAELCRDGVDVPRVGRRLHVCEEGVDGTRCVRDGLGALVCLHRGGRAVRPRLCRVRRAGDWRIAASDQRQRACLVAQARNAKRSCGGCDRRLQPLGRSEERGRWPIGDHRQARAVCGAAVGRRVGARHGSFGDRARRSHSVLRERNHRPAHRDGRHLHRAARLRPDRNRGWRGEEARAKHSPRHADLAGHRTR